MALDEQALELLFRDHGFHEYRWIDPTTIKVAQWVRMKCTYGCDNYGRHASCPPNVPAVSECRQFFAEYTRAVLFRFEKRVQKPQDRHDWSTGINEQLLGLEREVFLSGFERSFLLFMDSCSLCNTCTGAREQCARPKQARPSVEAMAVDVYSTVRSVGWPIQVLSDYSQVMNRYAVLLVE